jgi:hypothetical protein
VNTPMKSKSEIYGLKSPANASSRKGLVPHQYEVTVGEDWLGVPIPGKVDEAAVGVEYIIVIGGVVDES